MPIAIPMAVAMLMPRVYGACVDKNIGYSQRWGIKRPQMAYLAPNSIFIVIVNINVTNYRAEINEDHIINSQQ